MCGIVGQVSKKGLDSNKVLRMNKMLAHRGPDDYGVWLNDSKTACFGHRRLSIIDLSENGHQPMEALNRYVIVFNGEIYNYKELRVELDNKWNFKSKSDTETILAAFVVYGKQCVDKLRGMFAFAIWDDREKTLFCARDHFGIKPFYFLSNEYTFSFASEAKALIHCLEQFDLNKKALFEYLNFQFTLGEETLIRGINQLMPGHYLEYSMKNKNVSVVKYWDVNYEIDPSLNTEQKVSAEFRELLHDSVLAHLNSDVEVGSYLSGGVDSSLISILSSESQKISGCNAFHGKFTEYPGCDESSYASAAAKFTKQKLNIIDIKSQDFLDNIRKIIYYLDFPVAGPGSFPQYIVSELASKHVKVVLGGQGGDEIFGGYARYVVAYLEQCLRAGIMDQEDVLEIPFKSILPNIKLLKEYTPLIKSSWSKGLFDDFPSRYFSLVNRSNDFNNEINYEYFKGYDEELKDSYLNIFNSESSVDAGYFNKMLYFDFKTLLPALLHVEDRMSMAHGIESRVPFLDRSIIEFAAKVPPGIKFSNGAMKNILKTTFHDKIPDAIVNRKDKMGFTVPLKEMFSQNDFKDFLINTFIEGKHQGRNYMNYDEIITSLQDDSRQGKFSRKLWGMLSLELWHQEFQDKFYEYKNM